MPHEKNKPTGLFITGGTVKATLNETGIPLLKNHLTSLLQVQNLVILIGSGASFHLGSPHTRELPQAKVLELINKAGHETDDVDKQLLHALNPSNNGDLEKLLNGLQLASSLATQLQQQTISLGEGDATHPFNIQDIDSLRVKIGAALARACKLPGAPEDIFPEFRDDPLRAHRTFLSRIIRSRRANLPRPKLFTTNYDLVLEHSLDQLGYPYIDGFSGTVKRHLNLAYYGLDYHRVDPSSQRVLARAEGALYLHKIHGSLNWRSVTQSEASTGIDSLEVVQVNEEDTTGYNDRVLIYPTTAKEGDTLAYPYSDLMRLLGEAVQQEDTAIISVGYGFADAHINRILLRSLAMNPALHVFVAGPYAVLEEDDMAEALADENLVGQKLNDTGYALKETPVSALAQGADGRIAVLTGEAGAFTNFAELIPDPFVESAEISPSAIENLVNALQGVLSPSVQSTELIETEGQDV